MIDYGGPAFAFNERHDDGRHFYSHPGMTLRDWFAGQALGRLMMAENFDLPEMITIEGYAIDAYRIADAMMAERAKRKP
jgi:hypothetical protein